jgi:N-acyl homoserine lactone hydrolase
MFALTDHTRRCDDSQASTNPWSCVVPDRHEMGFVGGGQLRMRRAWVIVMVLCICCALAANAEGKAPIRLWRLDCGELRIDDLNTFSDSEAYRGKSTRLVVSCYLIQHGTSYLLWNTGLPIGDLGAALTGPGAKDESLTITIVSQLATLGVRPDQISEIGISHYHLDHTGQVDSFPHARLVIGRGDLDVLRRDESTRRSRALSHWLSGAAPLEAVDGDSDIYGDGSVLMLSLPGHTPGHHGLLLRLPKTGTVLLSGDTVHFRENYDNRDLPAQNTSRAESLASIDRVRALTAHTNAIFVIEHDARDVEKLPLFPAAAE